MDVTKPYEFIGFGATEVTKPYKFIGFGAMEVTKPYKFDAFQKVECHVSFACLYVLPLARVSCFLSLASCLCLLPLASCLGLRFVFWGCGLESARTLPRHEWASKAVPLYRPHRLGYDRWGGTGPSGSLPCDPPLK